MAGNRVCAVVADERFKNHFMGAGHPERPERLDALYKVLREPEFEDLIVRVEPRPATDEELQRVHTSSYVRQVAATAGREYTYLDPDTQTSAQSYETALLAAGGVIELVDRAWNGSQAQGLAFVRPPGHHAEADRAMGFCIFNNVAVAARYITDKLEGRRVLIVDWDLHHGNGTQHSFWRSKDVLYFSIHQFPHYPGTGRHDEVGKGDGEGYTVNVPVSYGADDKVYAQAFTRVLAPIALQYKPDFVLVSAGFDAHHADPLGGIKLTENGYRQMTKILKNIAHTCCGGKLVFALEGGYSLDALESSIREVLLELLKGEANPDLELVDRGLGATIQEVERVREVHKSYWDFS